MSTMQATQLAILGGPRSVTRDAGDIFHWPIVTKEVEDAALEVLRAGSMSAFDITAEFERDFAAWQGRKYALAHNTGTAAIQGAMFACGVGIGAEVICPSITYWGTGLQAFSLGATLVFAEIDPNTLCIDPGDIEHRITERTKAIIPVHYCGHPADMDPIMDIANRHGIKVIEDVSHAQGGLYKGTKVGNFGHIGAMSLMSGKSFAIGEGGILATDDTELYERALAWGHYARFRGPMQTQELEEVAGLPLGGYKYRMHQMSSAVGRVQIKYYDEQAAEIRKAMNYFWDGLEGTPGVRAHRVDESKGYTMAGWYSAHGLYRSEELGGLSASRFAEAVDAEGSICRTGTNRPLHLHPLLNTYDVYGHGKPTRIANAVRDVRQPRGSLPVSESIGAQAYSIPWFKHYRPEIIDEHIAAYRKVAAGYQDLIADDRGDPAEIGTWGLSRIK